ncbi:MAG TPA: DNA/RNA non-specific endonuclease [Magnetovibrio sp.]
MRHIKTMAVVIAVTAFSWSAHGADLGNNPGTGFDACTSMFPGGAIPNAQSSTVVDLCKIVGGQPIFAIRYDTTRKIPVWAAHRLTPEQMVKIKANSGTMKRPKFSPDPDLPSDVQAVDRSYTKSGFSRGHIVPANDMSGSKESYDATFHLSNVVPQRQPFNAGKWLGAEDALRTYVADKNTAIWDFSGTYGTVEDDPATPEREGPTIGSEPNAPTVPKCYYKVMAASQGDGQPVKVLALVYAWNDYRARTTWGQALTSLETLKQRSGIDFLSGVSMEAQYDAAYWGIDPPTQPADCE